MANKEPLVSKNKAVTGLAVVAMLFVVYLGLGLAGIAPMPGLSAAQASSAGAGTTQINGLASSTTPAASCGSALYGNAQTTQVAEVDKDAQSTLLSGGAIYNFQDVVAGKLNPGNFTTQPGNTYTAWASKSGYLGAVLTYQTSCTNANPQITLAHKTYDTAVTFNVINGNDLVTKNSQIAAPLPIANNSVGNFQIYITPSAKNKYVANVPISTGTTPMYAAWVNITTNASLTPSNYNSGQFSLTGLDGSTCTLKSLPANPTGTNTILQTWACTGDFDGNSQSPKPNTLSLAVLTDPLNATMSFCFVGYDYYQQVYSTPSAAKGSLQYGPVKDDGSLIQTPQCKVLYMS